MRGRKNPWNTFRRVPIPRSISAPFRDSPTSPAVLLPSPWRRQFRAVVFLFHAIQRNGGRDARHPRARPANNKTKWRNRLWLVHIWWLAYVTRLRHNEPDPPAKRFSLRWTSSRTAECVRFIIQVSAPFGADYSMSGRHSKVQRCNRYRSFAYRTLWAVTVSAATSQKVIFIGVPIKNGGKRGRGRLAAAAVAAGRTFQAFSSFSLL